MPRRRKDHIPIHDTLALVDKCGELLRRAGFERRYTSMKSEACYYGWPGHDEVIRVAAHRFGKNHGNPRDINGQRVVGKLMLCGTHLLRSGTMALSPEKMETMVAMQIGRYFLAVAKGSDHAG